MDSGKTGKALYFDTLTEEKDHIFDQNHPKPVSVRLSLRGNKLLAVHLGYHYEGLGEAIVPGRDYTFDGETLTILPAFLVKRPAEEFTVLSAEFDRGQSVVVPVFCTKAGILAEYPLYSPGGENFQFPRYDRFVDVSMETSSRYLHGGRPALRLAYDFRRTPKYYPASCKERRKRRVEAPRPAGVAVWIWSDGSGNRVSMKINSRDKASVFSRNTYPLTWKGWRRVLFLFDESFPIPVIFDNLLFVEHVEGARESGVVRLSDMHVICKADKIAAFGDLGETVDPDEPGAQYGYAMDFQGCTKGGVCKISVTKPDGTPPERPISLKIVDCRQKDGTPFPLKRATLPMRKGVFHTRRFTKETYPDDLIFLLRAKDDLGGTSPLMALNCAPLSDAYGEIPAMITRGVTKNPSRSMAFAWFTAPSVTESVLKIWKANQPESSAKTVKARRFYAREWVERVHISHVRVDLNREAAQFDAEVHNLAPGTAYAYRFGAKDAWSEVFTGKTLPKTIESFDGVLTADAQIGDQEAVYPAYAKLLRQGIAQAQAPYVMLSLGDLVNSAGKEQDYTRTIAAAPDIFAGETWIPTPGNHEWEHIREFANYKSHWNLPRRKDFLSDELIYSVVVGPVCFVSIVGYGGGLPLHLVDAARSELSAAKAGGASWLVVLTHSNPYGKSGESFNPRFYVPLFEEFGVDLVLCGHDHLYVRSTVWQGQNVPVGQGITYVSLGFAGHSHDRICRFPWQDYVFGDNPAHVTFKGSPDPTCATASFSKKRIVLRVSTASGREIDEIILEKRPKP